MTMYNPKNGVKPRYDGKGSEFGKVHRHLPKNCCMFDIDRMKGRATIDLELKKQNVCFMEYKTIFAKNEVEWKAMFEIKHHDSEYVREAMNCKIGTATFAQINLCKTLDCRFFIVIASGGLQPFEFYEYDFDNSNFFNRGKLSYNNNDKAIKINQFWKTIGLL